jgi:hypothetical protein
VISN